METEISAYLGPCSLLVVWFFPPLFPIARIRHMGPQWGKYQFRSHNKSLWNREKVLDWVCRSDLSFEFATSCSPRSEQIPDLWFLTSLLSFCLPGGRSASLQQGAALLVHSGKLFVYLSPTTILFTHLVVYFDCACQYISRCILCARNCAKWWLRNKKQQREEERQILQRVI